MKKMFSLLLLTSLSINSFAKDDVKSIRPIASFINHDTVNCKVGNDDKKNQPYYDLLGIFNNISILNLSHINRKPYEINGKPYKFGNTWVSGISSLRVTSIKQNETLENKIIIAINVKKYGVNFIEMGEFLAVQNEGKGDEIGGNGYYFILTGNPKTNLAQLKKLGLADDESFIFETPEQQTRLNCFFTG